MLCLPNLLGVILTKSLFTFAFLISRYGSQNRQHLRNKPRSTWQSSRTHAGEPWWLPHRQRVLRMARLCVKEIRSTTVVVESNNIPIGTRHDMAVLCHDGYCTGPTGYCTGELGWYGWCLAFIPIQICLNKAMWVHFVGFILFDIKTFQELFFKTFLEYNKKAGLDWPTMVTVYSTSMWHYSAPLHSLVFKTMWFHIWWRINLKPDLLCVRDYQNWENVPITQTSSGCLSHEGLMSWET